MAHVLFTPLDFANTVKNPRLLGKFKGWSPDQLAACANAAQDDWALVYLAYQISSLFNQAWANHIGQQAVNNNINNMTHGGQGDWTNGHTSIAAIVEYLGPIGPKTNWCYVPH